MAQNPSINNEFDLIVHELFSLHVPGRTYSIVDELEPMTGRVIEVLEFTDHHDTVCATEGTEYKFWALINKFTEYGTHSREYAFRKFTDLVLACKGYSKALASALAVAWALLIGQHKYETLHGHKPVSTRNFVMAWLEHEDSAYAHGDVY